MTRTEREFRGGGCGESTVILDNGQGMKEVKKRRFSS